MVTNNQKVAIFGILLFAVVILLIVDGVNRMEEREARACDSTWKITQVLGSHGHNREISRNFTVEEEITVQLENNRGKVLNIKISTTSRYQLNATIPLILASNTSQKAEIM